MRQFNYFFKLLFTVQEGQFVRIKCHNGEKNKLIIRVVRNLKIYTTVCSDVHTVTNLSHYPIVENVCRFILVKICFEFWFNKTNLG